MSVNGDAFLRFAKWLQEQDTCKSEIKSRSLINRAYYGAFHITKNFLAMDEGADHHDVIDVLKIRSEYMGDRLYDLFEKRKEADYRISHRFTPGKAERVASEVTEFLKDLRTEM